MFSLIFMREAEILPRDFRHVEFNFAARILILLIIPKLLQFKDQHRQNFNISVYIKVTFDLNYIKNLPAKSNFFEFENPTHKISEQST